ncbi:MAG: hypothetical protein Q9162_007132 [Coniocarpon cinnabarinum]
MGTTIHAQSTDPLAAMKTPHFPTSDGDPGDNEEHSIFNTLHEAYQTLPLVDDVAKQVTPAVKKDAIYGSLKHLILKHNLEAKFGITLLHRHYDIEPHERVVQHGPVMWPWDIGTTQNQVTVALNGNGYVKPRAWRFAGLDNVPFEYEYTAVDKDHELTDAELDFLGEFAKEIHRLGLQDLLGIRDVQNLDKKHTLELTVNRCNVMVDPADKPRDSMTQTLWTFSQQCQHDKVDPSCITCAYQMCHEQGDSHAYHHEKFSTKHARA